MKLSCVFSCQISPGLNVLNMIEDNVLHMYGLSFIYLFYRNAVLFSVRGHTLTRSSILTYLFLEALICQHIR